MRTRPSATRFVVTLLALALLAACSPSTDPEEEFAAAFERTLERSFSFTVELEADQSALADLGRGAGDAAALLSGLRLRGVVDGDDTELVLEALGGVLVEVRQVGTGSDGEGAFWLRAGVVDLLAEVGVDEFEAEDTVLAELQAAGAPAEVLGAVRTGFDGGWVGLAGGLGEAIDQAASEADVDQATAFGTDLRDFLDRYVVVTAFDNGILRAGLRLGDLLRAASGVAEGLPVGPSFSPRDLETDLASLPEVVAGDVRVVDGVVEELAFDVAQAARAFGREVDGRIVVRMVLTEHGRAGPVTAPEGVEALDSDVLDEAVRAILASLGIG